MEHGQCPDGCRSFACESPGDTVGPGRVLDDGLEEISSVDEIKAYPLRRQMPSPAGDVAVMESDDDSDASSDSGSDLFGPVTVRCVYCNQFDHAAGECPKGALPRMWRSGAHPEELQVRPHGGHVQMQVL